MEKFEVEIGAKKMIPGFEDNLMGLKTAQQKTFSLVFPEDYGNEKFAGKTADFEVEVTLIEEPKLPEVNEDFIKAYGLEEGSITSFREDVKNNMERELENALRAKLKNSVLDSLYEKIQISVPNTLIDREVENLLEPYKKTAKNQKIKLEDLHLPREVFEEQAKRRVALGLILGEIIQKNAIQLDANKVRSHIEEMSLSYERPEDVINWYYSDETRLNDVKQMVLEDQTIEWLVSQSKVSETTMNFSDVMDKR